MCFMPTFHLALAGLPCGSLLAWWRWGGSGDGMEPRLHQKSFNRGLNLAKLRLGDRWSGNQHHIPPWGNCGEAEAHALSQPPAHAIAHDGDAYSLAHREAKSAAG